MRAQKWTVVGLVWVMFVLPGFGQAPTGKGSVEVAGSGGISSALPPASEFNDAVRTGLNLGGIANSRITITDGTKTRLNAGGSVGVAVTRDLLVVGEMAQTRFFNSTIAIRTGTATSETKLDGRLLDMTGGISYQLPLHSSVVVPFVTGSFGVSRLSVGASGGALPSDFSLSENHLMTNWGGGARIYVSRSFGIRPEVKVIRMSDETYVRSGVAVFYQFGNSSERRP